MEHPTGNLVDEGVAGIEIENPEQRVGGVELLTNYGIPSTIRVRRNDVSETGNERLGIGISFLGVFAVWFDKFKFALQGDCQQKSEIDLNETRQRTILCICTVEVDWKLEFVEVCKRWGKETTKENQSALGIYTYDGLVYFGKIDYRGRTGRWRGILQ